MGNYWQDMLRIYSLAGRCSELEEKLLARAMTLLLGKFHHDRTLSSLTGNHGLDIGI